MAGKEGAGSSRTAPEAERLVVGCTVTLSLRRALLSSFDGFSNSGSWCIMQGLSQCAEGRQLVNGAVSQLTHLLGKQMLTHLLVVIQQFSNPIIS